MATLRQGSTRSTAQIAAVLLARPRVEIAFVDCLQSSWHGVDELAARRPRQVPLVLMVPAHGLGAA